MTHTTRPSRRLLAPGFSLLEITLVLVIIGLLMGVAAFNLVGGQKRAAIRTTKATMKVYKTAITSYMAANSGDAPGDLQTLIAAEYIEATGDGQAPVDSWKVPFYYEPTPAGAHQFVLSSAGPDKEHGSEDDIDVWTMDIDG